MAKKSGFAFLRIKLDVGYIEHKVIRRVIFTYPPEKSVHSTACIARQRVLAELPVISYDISRFGFAIYPIVIFFYSIVLLIVK